MIHCKHHRGVWRKMRDSMGALVWLGKGHKAGRLARVRLTPPFSTFRCKLQVLQVSSFDGKPNLYSILAKCRPCEQHFYSWTGQQCKQCRPAQEFLTCSTKQTLVKLVPTSWNVACLIATFILRTMVLQLWVYLKYWWNEIPFPSITITLDKLWQLACCISYSGPRCNILSVEKSVAPQWNYVHRMWPYELGRISVDVTHPLAEIQNFYIMNIPIWKSMPWI